MFNTVAKICILCLICTEMELASSLPLKHPISDLQSEVRVKRSPDNFSLFGYHLPFSVPKDTITDGLSNFRKIFVSERKRVGTPSDYGFQSIKSKHSKKNNETHIMYLVEGENSNKMLEEIRPLNAANHNYSTYHVDKKLIDDIFKDLMNDNIQSDNLNNMIQDNSEKIIEEQLKRIFKETRNNNSMSGDVTSTTDTANDISETIEYETTTTDDFLRLNSNVVASLLG